MNPINWRRVLIGGGVAGVILNIGGITSALLIGLPETFARFGVAPTAGTALLHSGIRLGLGIAAVFVYAGGFRQTLGPGAWTAARAGAVVWFIGYVPGSVVLHELGVLSDGQLAFALAWGLAEAVIASVAGGSLYRPAVA